MYAVIALSSLHFNSIICEKSNVIRRNWTCDSTRLPDNENEFCNQTENYIVNYKKNNN